MTDPYSTRLPQHFGEHVTQDFFGPDNPVIDGQRWARYPRGYRYSGPGRNTIFDGAPPLNPFTGRPFQGAVISAPRVSSVAAAVGVIIEATVGDAGGGEQFRRFLVGPGTPVALRLGQYQSARLLVSNLSAVPAAQMNVPVRIGWVDELPSVPDAGRLRAPPQIFAVAPAVNLVPDGAVELLVGDVGGAPGVTSISFGEYATAGGAVTRIRLSNIASTDIVRTLGVDFTCSAAFQGQFFLAGL